MKQTGPFATHTLIELHGCDTGLLNDPAALKELLLEAVRRGQGTIVTDVFHTFSPHGVSGIIVIAESHVAIHTWPEHGYAALDIFSCGTKLEHAAIRDWVSAGMRAARVECREFTRG
ncbi:MAG: adenosylmethionine decarboxylase [Verrucomicrobiota bacterium]|nr:adenosylmethionine decarboxylase [Verrucomicrobiota bacterium]